MRPRPWPDQREHLRDRVVPVDGDILTAGTLREAVADEHRRAGRLLAMGLDQPHAALVLGIEQHDDRVGIVREGATAAFEHHLADRLLALRDELLENK